MWTPPGKQRALLEQRMSGMILSLWDFEKLFKYAGCSNRASENVEELVVNMKSSGIYKCAQRCRKSKFPHFFLECPQQKQNLVSCKCSGDLSWRERGIIEDECAYDKYVNEVGCVGKPLEMHTDIGQYYIQTKGLYALYAVGNNHGLVIELYTVFVQDIITNRCTKIKYLKLRNKLSMILYISS